MRWARRLLPTVVSSGYMRDIRQTTLFEGRCWRWAMSYCRALAIPASLTRRRYSEPIHATPGASGNLKQFVGGKCDVPPALFQPDSPMKHCRWRSA